MFEQFGINQDTKATSINGWVIENLKKVPEIADYFTLGNIIVTVVKTENRRATEINIAIT